MMDFMGGQGDVTSDTGDIEKDAKTTTKKES